MLDKPDVTVVVEAAKPPITIDRARRYFLESTQATDANDRECRKDARYFHNDQLSADVRAKLMQRGQPIIFVNKVAPAINGILGIIDAAQTDPQAYPRNPDQQDAADIATKILRYLNDRANMERVKAQLSEDFFVYGTTAAIVGEAVAHGTEEIPVTRIAWEDFWFDPLSREHDFGDARYLGIRKWLDTEIVEALYPDTYKSLGNPFDSGSGGWFDGKGSIEEERLWIDRDRRRLRVLELYFKDGADEWQRVVFCEAGFLDFGASVYKDDKDKSLCPILAASYEVNRQTGDRYGPIRAMRPLQDEVNSRRSKLLNETNNRRVRQVQEGIDPKSKEIAKREAAKADGTIPYGWDLVNSPDIAEGQYLLLQQTEKDLDRLAPTPAILGRMGGADSGRARQILQQAGYTEWARSFSRLMALEERITRHQWFGARQFMTSPTWIRVTGEARAPEFLQVNVPKMGLVPQPMVNPQTGQPVIGPDGHPMIVAQHGQVGVEHAVALMDVDIILDTIQDTATLQQEQMQELLRYAEGAGISPFDPQFKLLLMLFPIVDQRRLIDKYDAVKQEMAQEQAQQQQAQMQQMQQQQQLQAMHIQSKAQKDVAQAHKAEADAALTEMEVRRHAMVEQFAQQLASLNQPQPPLPPLHPGY